MEIAAALSGIKGAMDLAKAALDAHDDAKAKEAINGMMSLLLDANTSALAMSSEARRLSGDLDAATRELRELRERESERNKYLLHEIARGRVVYQYREGNQNGVPPHYLCQNCFDAGIKSVLRLNPGYDGFVDEWVCANKAEHMIRMDK